MDENGEQEKLRKIRTRDLRDGMRFTKTVYIDKRNILVGPEVPVKKKDIERLLNWGINEVETAGELVSDSVPIAPKPGSLQPGHRVEAVARMEADLRKLVEEQLRNRKETVPVRDGMPAGFRKRDTSHARSVAEYYGSWQEDMEQFLDCARNDFRIERGEANRVVREIIEIAARERALLMPLMREPKRDNYLAVHSVNVAVYGAVLGESLSLEKDKMHNLVMGCLFLDIGMVRVPEAVTAKEGALGLEDIRAIHTHPVYGYQILVQQNGFPLDVGAIALEHHEKINGTGYPRKLSGVQISEFGRIVAILDTYEAMTGQRSYRDEYISFEAMKNVIASAQNNFDDRLLSMFLRQMGVYPIGSTVRLNNNAIGIVVATNPSLPMRPDIRIIRDEFGDPVEEEEIVRLATESDILIVKVLDGKEIECITKQA